MDLQNLNVAELSAQEIENTDGGAIGIGASLVIYGCCILAGVAVGYWLTSKKQ